MTFQAFLLLVAACLAWPLLVAGIERYCDEAAARARAEKKRAADELDMRLRLHEMEQHLATALADEVNEVYGHHRLKAEITYNEKAKAGFAVIVSAEKGERQILHVAFDLKKRHSDYPIILTLGDNDPFGYPDAEIATVRAMADEMSGFINSVVIPATVH